jgi:DNA integrity scanning protein DisA with diadenylate cyclase activity
MKPIEYFIWGYQLHFWSSARFSAEQLFVLLDKSIKPNVYIVGVLNNEREDRHKACVVPDDCPYPADRFVDVLKDAEHFHAIDNDRNIWHSLPQAQKMADDRLWRRAIRNAILSRFQMQKEYDGIQTYCSMPILLEDYWVSVVLQLEIGSLRRHYSLSKTEWQRMRISTSLIDATIQEYLDLCAEALTKPDPGAGGLILGRPFEEIIRTAAENLMYTPAAVCNDFDGLHGLYNACNMISSLKYEGIEGVGEMLVSRRNHPNVEIVLELATPIPIRQYRAVRKILQVSSAKYSILCDSAKIYGLGFQTGIYNELDEDLYRITFTRHFTWNLFHGNHHMMRVAFREPTLPKSSIDRAKFTDTLRRVINDIKPPQTNFLWTIVQESAKQKHGTLVIISRQAKEETERLRVQSIAIEPVVLKPEFVPMVSSIDGAIMLDPAGVCHSIGVILDGLATHDGDASRGARYNSAVRYIQGKKETIAIIVSADGMVDILPNLMPRILRTTIPRALTELEEIPKTDELDTPKYYKLMDMFGAHRFYLTPSDCDRINKVKKDVDTRLEGQQEIRLIYEDFQPNEKLDDSYFYDELTDRK